MAAPPEITDKRAALAAQRRRRREVAAGVIGAVLAAFALLNLGDVKVDWGITTAQTPLIVVIVLSLLLGALLDRLLIRRRKRQRLAVESANQKRERESTAPRA